MRIKLFTAMLFILFLIPLAAGAVSQDTVDKFIFLLRQPDWTQWDDGVFDDATLEEGLNAIYSQAVNGSDDILARQAVWAMGETGLVPFVPAIIEILDDEPVVACFALGKISSEDCVEALIGVLGHEDMQVRHASVWGLGSMLYASGMDDARNDALEALGARLDLEEEDWVLEEVQAAITFIETGIATDPMFIDLEE